MKAQKLKAFPSKQHALFWRESQPIADTSGKDEQTSVLVINPLKREAYVSNKCKIIKHTPYCTNF
jgi:hypothetical protein